MANNLKPTEFDELLEKVFNKVLISQNLDYKEFIQYADELLTEYRGDFFDDPGLYPDTLKNILLYHDLIKWHQEKEVFEPTPRGSFIYTTTGWSTFISFEREKELRLLKKQWFDVRNARYGLPISIVSIIISILSLIYTLYFKYR